MSKAAIDISALAGMASAGGSAFAESASVAVFAASSVMMPACPVEISKLAAEQFLLNRGASFTAA